ncbi:transcriptional modulator of MazE/toxin, MazF [Candidatus Desulforudis audaxviator MP104C]|uniref:Transcriptional modulator of MazE/toxin, MazF n=1 Tax=Desulforudis audaxviator (strain MP104C) TaxID=477974 RepID=B1I286_DESAP|nr:transcriptional modulator of MazE/toxin, MazF [Candidatus Desulforudis audaxviator MP104C]
MRWPSFTKRTLSFSFRCKRRCFAAEIKRGGVFLTDFNPARGSEQAGCRPAVVVQNDVGNKYSPTTIVIVVTTTHKDYPFMVKLSAGEGGLERDSEPADQTVLGSVRP